MRALIIGAGAVGQVYGHHLKKGGARVALFVREKYAAEARRGFDLIHVHSRSRRVPARFTPDEVLTSAQEVAARSFRQVWMTTSTPPLLRGELDAVLRVSKDATIVCLQPGLSVASYLARLVPPEHTVFGTIGMQSYTAPLEGSEDPIEVATGPGIAYTFPPFVPSVFGGPEDRARGVVDALRAGGTPANVKSDAVRSQAAGSAALIPVIAGLEASDWSFDKFTNGPVAELAARAAREAMNAIAMSYGGSRAPLSTFIRGPVLGLIARIARAFAPIDIEAFLRYHFRKVGDQTRFMLSEFTKAANQHELDHTALDQLRERLGDTPL